MDWDDVTTDQILNELCRRYGIIGIVGEPKSRDEPAFYFNGDKRNVDSLMAEFIAGRMIATVHTSPDRVKTYGPRPDLIRVDPKYTTEILMGAMTACYPNLIVCGAAPSDPSVTAPFIGYAADPTSDERAAMVRLERLRQAMRDYKFYWESQKPKTDS